MTQLSCYLSQAWYIVLGVCGIGFLIGFHEMGHYLFARLFGIRAPSFSIGMGPQLFSITKWGTTFSLSAIPLGGYVEIAGLQEVGQGEQKHASDRDMGAFSNKPYWQKLLVLSGGIIFNLLFAYLAVALLFAIGAPKRLVDPQAYPAIITTLVPEGAAARSGLQAGDHITMIGETPVATIGQMRTALQTHAGTQTAIFYEQPSADGIAKKTVSLEVPASGLLGISGFDMPDDTIAAESFTAAITKGISLTNNLIARTASGFMLLFSKKETGALGGPVQIVATMVNDAKQGLRAFLTIMVLISINLALLNIIPVPILDGGQILLTTIEAIIGKELPEKGKLYVHYACWILVMILFIILTIKDIDRLFLGGFLSSWLN